MMRYLNVLGLLALEAVLAFALYDQFFQHDLPCPLCLLQRLAFVACMFAVMLNIIYGVKPWHYGLLVLSAIYGAAVSLRQASLHVIPGSPAYGDCFFGLHYYTWAFIVFSIILLITAFLLLLQGQYVNEEDGFIRWKDRPWWANSVMVVGILIVLLNAGLALLECGFGACADNPENYRLLIP